MTVTVARTDVERAAAFAVRHEVFVLEQGVPAELEIDVHDATAVHFICYDAAVVVAAVRLVVEEPGFAGADPARGSVGHLGRLAVRRASRGRGLGAQLVRAVEAHARSDGLSEMALSAQTQAIPFYERLGYVAHGPEYDDAGLPHRWMRTSL